MRTLLLFIIASALCLTAKAVENDFPYPPNNIIVFTNTPAYSNITATTTFTNVFETKYSIYHTFELFSTGAGTNTVTMSLDRTIDNTNWITCVNNASVTNGTPFETNYTGKWWSYRIRVTAIATNDTIEWLYMGQ
jgi:hypothetical protein